MHIPGFNGPVYALTTWDPDGPGPQPELLVAGGHFSLAGGVMARNIAAWDGIAWQPLGGGAGDGVGNRVQCMIVYQNELIVGGLLTTAGGVAVNSVAGWNGTSWRAVGSYGISPSVSALAIHNGSLIAVGRNVNNSRCVLRLSGSTWSQLGDSLNADGYALAVYDNDLIVGGQFTKIGGTDIKRIARWNGTIWQSLGTGVDYSEFGLPVSVQALTLHNGELIAAGEFTMAGGVGAKRTARWNGTTWQALGSSSGVDRTVRTLATYGGELIAGGEFSDVGYSIARWTGSGWQGVGGGICNFAGCIVRASAVFDGKLVVAGEFHSASGVSVDNIASWNGTAWESLGAWSPGRSTTDCVEALANYDGKLIAAGTFATFGGASARNIAAWNGDAWTPLGSGLDDRVRLLGIYSGELIAGGYFLNAGGVSATGIARWNGSAWSPLGGGLRYGSLAGAVYAFAEFNGELVAGGGFSQAGDTYVSRIARWNGSIWQPLGNGLNMSVNALTVFNGALIAGGSFLSSGSTSLQRIARWDGSTWQPVGGGMSGGDVQALCVYNGELVAAGDFTTAGTTTVNRIARWDGSIWQPLGAGLSGPVSALCVHQGDLIAAGSFMGAGNQSARHIARWSGSTWQPLAEGTDGTVYDLISLSDELAAGGDFLTAGSQFSACVARWAPAGPSIITSPAAQTVALGGPVTLSVVTSGNGTVTYRWYKDGQPLVDDEHLSGSGEATLTIDRTRLTDAGSYDVLVEDACGSTRSIAAQLTINCPGLIAVDFDGDCDVDRNDLEVFQVCVSGPAVAHDGTARCLAADLDHDGDVDLDDFGRFQQCYCGAGLPANLDCDQ